MNQKRFDQYIRRLLIEKIECDDTSMLDFIQNLRTVSPTDDNDFGEVDCTFSDWCDNVEKFRSNMPGFKEAFVWLCRHTEGHSYPEAVQLRLFIEGKL